MGSRAPGSNIESLVYFDMETTGLPRDIPRITELSMVAVSVRDCINNKDIRIINKLTLCFNPDSVLTAEAAEISGLSNSLLEKMPQFDGEAVRMIDSFLGRLPGEVCLVAHNGQRFDFPILMSELLKTRKTLETPVLCVDSLQFARDQYPGRSNTLSALHERLFSEKPSDEHRAEADCQTLLKITQALGERFINFIRRKSTPLDSIHPMW